MNDCFGLIQGMKAEWSLNKQTMNEKDFDGIRSWKAEKNKRENKKMIELFAKASLSGHYS